MGVEDVVRGVCGGSIGCCCGRDRMVGVGVDVPELVGVVASMSGEECVAIVINGAVVFCEHGRAAGITELTN